MTCNKQRLPRTDILTKQHMCSMSILAAKLYYAQLCTINTIFSEKVGRATQGACTHLLSMINSD